MGKVDCLRDRVEPFAVLFWALGIVVLASTHRRRIELEDKAKVVAPFGWAKFVQFLAALAVCLCQLGKIG